MGKILWTLLASALASAIPAQIVWPYGATISVGPTSTHGLTVPISNWYTWESSLSLTGQGWSPGEQLVVHLKGPLNTLGAAPTDRIIGTAIAGSNGVLTAFTQYGYLSYGLVIPFNEVTPFPSTNDAMIPRPGFYTLEADGPNANHNPIEILPPDYATVQINIGPDGISTPTNDPYEFDGWPRDRGARMGFLGGDSPEMADPEWLSIWNDKPVDMYATIVPTQLNSKVDDPPANQPAFISHADLPFTHYGHDVNMELAPDPDYLWLLGSGNFWSETMPGKANFARMECEWETQSNGRPVYGSYGQGNIGMPLFVMPSAGDRVYMVGRWVFDNGHPDGGDRTEIHPVRMLATMRQRYTATRFLNTAAMTKAQQVDVYVSGHGGGANRYPDGLSETMDWQGGGGMLQNILSNYAMAVYFGFGPADSELVNVIVSLLNLANGSNVDVLPAAGPSGEEWPNGPEFRPVNDMDYAFDVPLPPSPAGATAPEYSVTTQPWNNTQVKESVSYTNVVNGLPRTAHIVLPYLGADNGIYAKTFKFYWNVYSQPGRHFSVQINDLKTSRGSAIAFNNTVYYGPGPMYMWADVCGQWASLTDADPFDMTNLFPSATSGLNQATFEPSANGGHALKFDVYLDNSDTLRVFTHGYGARDFDKLFGVDVGKTAYNGGLDLVKAQVFGNGENMNLGGALYEGPIATTTEFEAVQGLHTELSYLNNSKVSNIYGGICPGPVFTVDFTTTYVPRPPAIAESGLPMNFGSVEHGATAQKVFVIRNTGEATLAVTNVTVAGLDFGNASPTSFSVAPGRTVNVTLTFAPRGVANYTGTVTIKSNDPLHPSLTYNLSGKGF